MKPSAVLLPLLVMYALQAGAASPQDDRFAAAERARYAALCRAHRDLSSCSDAVRWSPGDATLVVALADALVRARRLPEALRDYQHAWSLQPDLPGLDAKINAIESKLSDRHAPRKPAVAAAAKHYSNTDPETQSH